MSTDAGTDTAAVLATLLRRFVVDRDSGELASLVSYQAAYPGYEDLVAEHYAAVHGGDGDDAPGSLGDDPPLTIGHYRVERELGRGGQGVVYLAEDEKLDRNVALKVLNLGAGLPDAALRRFRREAELASRLEHPGICAVYDVGSDHGTQWFAMRFVEGETLAQRVAVARRAAGKPGATPSTRAEVLDMVRLIEDAARALHEAHEAGIVHRDVKPGNIMVTPKGEPVILDFGLARDEHEATVLTQTGGRFGTPQYMSPEQLAGERSLVDRRTDVWALGVTLYECLTLRTPFDGPTPDRVQSNILTAEPSRPGRSNTHVPRDLEVVLEKALEKDPRRRYATALAFADDLARVRTHRPISARPLSAPSRALRWARRRPAAAALVVVVALSVPTVSALLGSWLSTREVAAFGLDEMRRQRAEELVNQGYFCLQRIMGGTRTPEADLLEARKCFEDALEQNRTEALALCGLALTYLKRLYLVDDGARAALAVLDEHASDFAGDSEFLAMKAYLLRRAGHVDEAAAVEADLEHAPGAVRHFLEGWFHLTTAQVGNLDAGDAAFRSLFRARLLGPPRLIFHVMCLHAAGKSRQDDAMVTDLVDTLLDLWPESAQAWIAVGQAYFDRDPARAAHAFEKATVLDDNNHRAHAVLGLMRNRLGQRQRAIASVKKALEIEPDLALAHAYLGLFLNAEGDLDGAERELRTAVDLNPHWSRSQAWLSMVLRLRGDLEGAVEVAQTAIDLDRGDGGGHDALAKAYWEQKRYDEAAAAMEVAIATNPPGWAAAGRLAWLADVYDAAGQPDQAEACRRRGMTLAPGRHWQCILLVRRLEETGRHAEVADVIAGWRNALEQATRDHPEHPAAWTKLATFLAHDKLDEVFWDPKQALAAAQRAAELATEPVWSPWTFSTFHRYEALHALARALYVNGEYAEAAEFEAEALARVERAQGPARVRTKYRERLEEYERSARER